MVAAGPTPPGRVDASARRARRVLGANGVFLAIVGSVQVVFEIVGHFAGRGPFGAVFEGSTFTIGFVEAHGLAVIVGALMILAAREASPQPRWHGVSVAVHALLGGANLLFWDSFVAIGIVPVGVAATLLHGVFFAAGAWLVLARRTPSRARPEAARPRIPAGPDGE